MHKTTVSLVALLATMVSACDVSPSDEKPKQAISQRDVYNSLEDCIADWGDTDLCERQMKEAREHAEKMAQAGGNHGAVIMPMFFGPPYVGDSRSTLHNGKTITPTTTTASRTANIVNRPGGGRIISYASPTSPVSSPSTSKGGFGATGARGGGIGG